MPPGWAVGAAPLFPALSWELCSRWGLERNLRGGLCTDKAQQDMHRHLEMAEGGRGGDSCYLTEELCIWEGARQACNPRPAPTPCPGLCFLADQAGTLAW